MRDRPSLIALGVVGAFLALFAAVILPLWPMLGVFWYVRGSGWLALTVVFKAAILWALVLYARALVALGMGISPWYAFTLPLGSAVFAATMMASTWKVLSGQGVLWKGRRYALK